MWNKYINATDINQVIDLIDEYGDDCRIIAGGTDLFLDLKRGDGILLVYSLMFHGCRDWTGLFWMTITGSISDLL